MSLSHQVLREHAAVGTGTDSTSGAGSGGLHCHEHNATEQYRLHDCGVHCLGRESKNQHYSLLAVVLLLFTLY